MFYGTKMEPRYLIDLKFKAIKKILSLPPIHAARWSAWFRFACKNINVTWEDAFIGLIPFRNGQKPILEGEVLTVRLVLSEKGLAILPRLTSALSITQGHGEFSSSSLQLCSVKDVILDKFITSLTDKVSALDLSFCTNKIAQIKTFNEITLEFKLPLRLTLPAGQKSNKTKDELRYCHKEFFENNLFAVSHLLRRIRGIEEDYENSEITIVQNTLHWVDMSYSEKRCIHLGGLVGKLVLKNNLKDVDLERIVIGQYLGAGKDSRFGFGYWHIPGLD